MNRPLRLLLVAGEASGDLHGAAFVRALRQRVPTLEVVGIGGAQLQAEGKMTDAHAALAKAFTTAKCRETVAWARELLGGNGIAADYNVGRFFADAEALYSYEGTYQMQNMILGKAITGFSAFV